MVGIFDGGVSAAGPCGGVAPRGDTEIGLTGIKVGEA